MLPSIPGRARFLQAAAIALAAACASCTSLIGGKAEIRENRKFIIESAPLSLSLPNSERPYALHVEVGKFDVSRLYDRNQIVLRQSAEEIREKAYHSWAVRAQRDDYRRRRGLPERGPPVHRHPTGFRRRHPRLQNHRHRQVAGTARQLRPVVRQLQGVGAAGRRQERGRQEMGLRRRGGARVPPGFRSYGDCLQRIASPLHVPGDPRHRLHVPHPQAAAGRTVRISTSSTCRTATPSAPADTVVSDSTGDAPHPDYEIISGKGL